MRIGIDVDGVIRDFITAFKSVVGQEYPNAKIPESISTWKFEDDITDLSREEIKKFIKKNFVNNVFKKHFLLVKQFQPFGHLKNGLKEKDTS